MSAKPQVVICAWSVHTASLRINPLALQAQSLLCRGADLNSVGDGAGGDSIRIRGTSTKGQKGTSALPRGQDGADEAVDAISCDSFLVSHALFGWLEGMDDSFAAGAGGLFDRSKLGAGAGAGPGDRVSRLLSQGDTASIFSAARGG
jgi:hypothetical protein